MCTVSFLPNAPGFHVAMNRDEKRTRSVALPPAIVDVGTRRAIFPAESNGGTWIAANDAGVCLALINWHRIEREPKVSVISRGQVIRKLAGLSSTAEIARELAALPLSKLRPFRLIGFVASEKTITEWRWNLERLTSKQHAWQRQHWFSSGFDERAAERVRADVCASSEVGGDDLVALRRLHRSHAPERGPFSICMHRDDAATVSYTEVAVEDRQLTMRYKAGSPCLRAPLLAKRL